MALMSKDRIRLVFSWLKQLAVCLLHESVSFQVVEGCGETIFGSTISFV